MKKFAVLLTSVIILMSTSTVFAAMDFSWSIGKESIPNDFRGKLTKFYYKSIDGLGSDLHRSPVAVVDVVRNDGKLVEITFTDTDFAFGSTLHGEVGKNVWLLLHALTDNKHDAMNPGGIVTQFSVLQDENR